MNDVRSLIESFVGKLTVVVEQQAAERARMSLETAFGGGGKGSRRLMLSGRPRRKLPRQLCPVPGCKNTAAPVFGMVCANHKDVPKTQIKKYREARRAQKLKTAA
jgi:hypothetical protein